VTVCAFNTTAVPGMIITGVNPNLVPQTGRSWSGGIDFKPTFRPDLTLSATYWHTELHGGVTSRFRRSRSTRRIRLAADDLSERRDTRSGRGIRRLSAAAGAFAGSDLLLVQLSQSECVESLVEGIDAEIRYSPQLSWGSISSGVATTYKTRFDQQVGSGAPSSAF